MILLLAAILGCASAGGSVRRRLTVRTNPPGALVYVDDQEIGKTPVSTSFVYYGTRKIRLVKDGYDTVTVFERFRPPWYELPPIDFVAENLWPWEVRDERIVDFELVLQRIVPTQQLLGRADRVREGARRGYTTPLPQTSSIDALPEDATRRMTPQPPAADVYNPALTTPPPPPPE